MPGSHASERSSVKPRRLTAALLLAALATVVGGTSAHAERNLIVGVVDDAFLYQSPQALSYWRDFGRAVRVNMLWRPGYGSFDAMRYSSHLPRLIGSTSSTRIVVSLYAPTAWTQPKSDLDRTLFCNAAGELVRAYPQVRDVIIGNEPNTKGFWLPQFNADGSSAAPAAYTLLLAHCYDVLHAARPDINLVAAATSSRGNDDPRAGSNAGHSPVRFVTEMGKAYRALGRTRPLFDTIDHHPYPLTSAERPWKQHVDARIAGQGDLDRLVLAYRAAFAGTAQPTPGRCIAETCVSVWFTENGFQTRSDSFAAHYAGTETDKRALPASTDARAVASLAGESSLAPDQATQLRDALELAYCQPYVTAYFNFQLVDEPGLQGWQAGLLYATWLPKPSYAVFREMQNRVQAGAVDCQRFARPLARIRAALR